MRDTELMQALPASDTEDDVIEGLETRQGCRP
jgi:hypothetical protein